MSRSPGKGYASAMALHVPKSRRGSLPISVARLVKQAAFYDELSKLAMGQVSDEEAIDAAKQLSVDPRTRARRYAESGVVGGALNPVVNATGTFVQGVVEGGKGRRLASGLAAAGKKLRGGEVAGQVTKGLLGGMAVQAGREGLRLQEAKDTYQRFMQQHGQAVE